MSTLDYYQNLRSLVSTSVMDNLPQIEDNLKNLFEDISTYFYFHGDEETSFKRNEMVVKAKLSIKHPIVLRLNEEGKLIASCQPVLLSILSIKEIRMLFKMDSEIYNPQNLSNRVRHGTNPVNGLGKGTYRQTVLNGPMKKSLRKRFGKYPKQDYKELSERPGDFFQQATAFQKRETVPQPCLCLTPSSLRRQEEISIRILSINSPLIGKSSFLLSPTLPLREEELILGELCVP